MAEQKARTRRSSREEEPAASEEVADLTSGGTSTVSEDAACCLADIDCCLEENTAEPVFSETDQALEEFSQIDPVALNQHDYDQAVAAWQRQYRHLLSGFHFAECCGVISIRDEKGLLAAAGYRRGRG